MSEPGIVYVVDDDEPVRDSVGLLLETLDIPYSAFGTAQEFLDAFDPARHGALVLDIRMPGMSGLELQRRLADVAPHLPIIFITGHGDIPMAVEAMKRGAVDFLRKPFREQELLDSIQQALQIEQKRIAEEARLSDVQAHYEQLTPREKQVFERVTNGQANKVIAIELGISERTVEIHRGQVMHKMEARTLPDLVRQRICLDGTVQPQEAS